MTIALVVSIDLNVDGIRLDNEFVKIIQSRGSLLVIFHCYFVLAVSAWESESAQIVHLQAVAADTLFKVILDTVVMITYKALCDPVCLAVTIVIL